ncbi:MAG: ATP-dependent helicase [Bacteroidetes bacterium]|nr:ATP-dependent helicase [Bacteroidota bacterium]
MFIFLTNLLSYLYESRINGKNSISVIQDSLPARQRTGFREFASIFEDLKKIKSPESALRKVIDAYQDYCYLSFDNADERILDLEELAKLASSHSTVKEFLLDFSSFEEFKGETLLGGYEREESLVLSTIHQAKGLEWEVVFIIGFCEYSFPHPKALDCASALEEERRLFYVSLTRARHKLFITYCRNRTGQQQHSGFFNEATQKRNLTRYLKNLPSIKPVDGNDFRL